MPTAEVIEKKNSSKRCDGSKRVKAAIVTNIIPPYRRALFEAIGREVELTVIISAAMEQHRLWKAWDESEETNFKTKILKGLRLKHREGFFCAQPALFRQLSEQSPDIIINCGFNLNSLFGAIYAKKHKKKALLWSEATVHSESKYSGLRKLYRKILIHLNDGFIAPGTEAREYLLSLGAESKKCFLAVDAIEDIRESDFFEELKEQAAAKRKGFGQTVLIYSGQLIKRKGIDLLLKAYKEVCDKYDTTLLIMGNGPREDELKDYVKENGLKGVQFLGFKDEKEKWIYYLASDVFILPTREDVWGLVVNEAMLCGLPVICSKYSGAARDLVIDGENGRGVQPEDTESFSQVIEELLQNRNKREQMGLCSLEIIEKYSIEESAKGFFRAIGFCRSTSRI